MKWLHEKDVKERGFIKRAFETGEEPFESIQGSFHSTSPRLTETILTYAELQELKMALAKFEAQKAEVIERLRIQFF
ncbi:MAG: hypothetical protein JSV05_02550 [Candidatus Bathyarchaeota archaeon]|nr:MAG: hypothetical protein JSV05_02550 [Candidatus Bathyarchaeota archaeon]